MQMILHCSDVPQNPWNYWWFLEELINNIVWGERILKPNIVYYSNSHILQIFNAKDRKINNLIILSMKVQVQYFT